MQDSFIQEANEASLQGHKRDVEVLAAQLHTKGINIERVLQQLMAFEVAIPSWALGTGGTRFGRFPGRRRTKEYF